VSKNLLDLSIIIPFKDKSELTLPCVHSLIKYNPGIVKEIVLISNNSSQKELDKVRDAVKDYPEVKIFVEDIPFNFQTLNNIGAKKSSGKVIMMLNNDTEFVPQSVGLLEYMYNKALEPSTGAVGAVLVYEDKRTIQHAGVYLLPGGTADHLYIGRNLKAILRDESRRFNIAKDLQVSAATAAVLMISRKHFNEIDGMDENFIVGGGDVDICLRLEKAGYKNFVAGADNGIIIHKESKTRDVSSLPYSDFCVSYDSYIDFFDITKGDPHLPWEAVKNA